MSITPTLIQKSNQPTHKTTNMNKTVKISDRATGPVVPVSYKGIAKKRSKANGGEAPVISDFINEDQRGQTLELTLVNNSESESKVIAVYPGMLRTVEELQRYAGAQVDAIAKEGQVTEDVTCTSKTLNLAQRWIEKHPMRFSKLHLQVNVDRADAQFSKEIKFYGFALGKTAGDVAIRPQDFVRSDQYNRNIVDIDVSVQLDDATVMTVELAPKSELSISLQIVSEMNTSMALGDMIKKLEA